MDTTTHFHVTPRQHQAINMLISYPDQIQAAAAMGIKWPSYRLLLYRARKATGCDTNIQLVHKWTIQQVKHHIQNEITAQF